MNVINWGRVMRYRAAARQVVDEELGQPDQKGRNREYRQKSQEHVHIDAIHVAGHQVVIFVTDAEQAERIATQISASRPSQF